VYEGITVFASWIVYGQGGIVGRLGFRVGVSASYRYITSFGKLKHKLRHTSFGIVDLRNSGPESYRMVIKIKIKTILLATDYCIDSRT